MNIFLVNEKCILKKKFSTWNPVAGKPCSAEFWSRDLRFHRLGLCVCLCLCLCLRLKWEEARLTGWGWECSERDGTSWSPWWASPPVLCSRSLLPWDNNHQRQPQTQRMSFSLFVDPPIVAKVFVFNSVFLTWSLLGSSRSALLSSPRTWLSRNRHMPTRFLKDLGKT